MSENLTLPTYLLNTTLATTNGENVSIDIPENSDSYRLILPNNNVSGNLYNDGTGNLSWEDFKVDASGGSDAVAGTATLSSGTITVNTSTVKSSSIILISYKGASLTNAGILSTHSIIDDTSFVIESSNGLDDNEVNWWIING